MHGGTMRRALDALWRLFAICGLGLLWLITAPIGIIGSAVGWAGDGLAVWAAERIAELIAEARREFGGDDDA